MGMNTAIDDLQSTDANPGRVRTPVGPAARLDFLSCREGEVLALMADGLTNAGIARDLWLTERTVEAHISRIMIKLGLADERHFNRRVLAVLAYLEGAETPALPGETPQAVAAR